MREIAVHVDVPDLCAPATTGARRIAGLTDGNRRIVVATVTAGGTIATPELEFEIGAALALAEAVLSGDARAKTHPGLARMLSATAAILFRVAFAAGGIEKTGDLHGRDDYPDRGAAEGDGDDAG